jgi:hypothetical protein
LVGQVRGYIVQKVIRLTTAVVVRERAVAQKAAHPEGGGGGGGKLPPPGSKRPAQQQLRFSPCKHAKAADDDEAHLYGQIEEAGGQEGEEDEMRAADEAKELVMAFIEWCKSEFISRHAARNKLLTEFPREKVHHWWAKVGVKVLQKKWVRLGWVARALLSITAGSGNLERYFCNIPSVVTAKRSSLSPARVEMLIICHILQQVGQRLTPDEIKPLSKEQVKQALPGRMKKAALMRKLKEMFEGTEMSDEERDLWVPDDVAAMAPWSSVAEMVLGWDQWDVTPEAMAIDDSPYMAQEGERMGI